MDREFIETMVRDSHDLERRNEPGQAFDKLARAVESLVDDPGSGAPLLSLTCSSHFGTTVSTGTLSSVARTFA